MALIDTNGLLYGERYETSELPKESGIYAMFEGQRLLYIGKAKNLRRRTYSHKFIMRTQVGHNYHPQCRPQNLSDIRFGYLVVPDAIDREMAEWILIRHHRPPFNCLVGGKRVFARVTR